MQQADGNSKHMATVGKKGWEKAINRKLALLTVRFEGNGDGVCSRHKSGNAEQTKLTAQKVLTSNG